MNERLGTIGAILALVLLPSVASGEALGTESASSSASLNPLIYVETRFDLGLQFLPSSVALSPDGAHVYVAGSYDNAVAVFGRSAATGVLTYEASVRDGVGGVDGLFGAKSVTVSPDGAHVYVAGVYDNAVAFFSRNASTGALTYEGVVKDGVGGVDGLGGAKSVTVSPDGKHVYVASDIDDALAGFIRNPTTGALTYLGAVKDGTIADDLDGAASVALSPDGAHLYVAACQDDAVTIFSRNASAGTLTYEGVVKDGIGGVDGLNCAISVTVSPDGAHVYVAGPVDNAVAVFGRGASTGALTFVEMIQDGDGGADRLLSVASVAVSPDGSHVYVTSSPESAVTIFGRNATTGALTYAGVAEDDVLGVGGPSAPQTLAISSDGKHVYVAAAGDDAVVSFGRNSVTGALTSFQTCESVPGLEGAAGAAVSPDGAHVYVAGNDDDAVVGFERNQGTGALVYAEIEADSFSGVDGLAGARAVVVSPDGAHVYVAGFDDDAVAGFSRLATTGELTYEGMVKDGVEGVDGLNGPQDLAISSDGKHVYVASYYDDAVVIFERSSGSAGELSYLGMIQDGAGADGLNGAYSVVVSPDGKHVYVAGITDDAVAIFSRNATSGALTYEGVVKDTDPSISGLNGANSLAISPDGMFLYVASRDEDALQMLLRNSTTGALFEIQVHRDGVSGVDGLNGARAVAVSPDGSQVYVASQVDHALAVFAWDPGSGGLSFVGMHEDGVDGVNGLRGAMAVAVSPDSGHVYVGGYSDDGVAVFAKWRVYLPLVLGE